MTEPSGSATYPPPWPPDITGPDDHFCCDCFAFNHMPCCNAHHVFPPAWAEAWRPGKCSCGDRLVLVFDQAGQSAVVCRATGLVECDGG